MAEAASGEGSGVVVMEVVAGQGEQAGRKNEREAGEARRTEGKAKKAERRTRQTDHRSAAAQGKFVCLHFLSDRLEKLLHTGMAPTRRP